MGQKKYALNDNSPLIKTMTASIRGSDAATYYLQLDHTLYYLTGELGVGVWHGEGAFALGFKGVVLPEALKAAYEGFSPDGSKRLVQQQGNKSRQAAWDITLSCPKYLSVLWSALPASLRHRLEAVVMEAAKRAVDYVDAEALYTRRGKYGAAAEKAKGVYALIPHGTSRALDPQLHVHVLCINISLRADSSTGTIRSRDLYLHKMAVGAVFHLELASLLLREFGMVTVPDEDSPWTFKIPGVPAALCDEQSKRRKAILALAEEAGWNSPKVLSQLALATRKPKGFVDLGDCFDNWRETAEGFGFTSERAQQVLVGGDTLSESSQQHSGKQDDREQVLNRLIDQAVQAVAVSDAYFPERRVLQEANTLLQGQGYSASEVIGAVSSRLRTQHQQIEVPREAEYRYFSTKENIASEQELIERVKKGIASEAHLATKLSVERAIKKEEQLLSKAIGTRTELTDDQKRAALHITLTPGDDKLIQGLAGTGKTQMLNVAHRAWRECGYNVLGASMTGRAAQGLQQTTKIRSVTVASLLQALRPELSPEELRRTFWGELKAAVKKEKHEARRAGEWMRNPLRQAIRELGLAIKNAYAADKRGPRIKLTENTILVVDEVAMLPTQAWLAIKQECDKAGAKLVGVGDWMQHSPIDAGSPMRSLINVIGCEALTAIVRQRHEWMISAAEHIIADRPLDALQLYHKHNSLTLAPHKQAAVERLAEAYWYTDHRELPKAAAIATTNAEVKAINHAVQQKRKAAHLLSLESTKLSNGERVHVGDIVALRQNDYGLGVRNGIRGTVIGITHPKRLLHKATLQIALHGESAGWAVFRGPKVISIDLARYSKVQLGYAISGHLAQGLTLRNTHVLLGDSMLSKNIAYTMLTRHTDQCKLYALEQHYGESLEQLSKEMSRSVTKDLATDYKLVTEVSGQHRCEEASSRLAHYHQLHLSREL